ncbi:MAG: DedA family protein [Planctomycetota bacterium]|nr:MAG: DedA family protein [Planctomycetota bacterium]
MDEAATIFDKIAEVCRHLFSSQELMATLQKPGFMLAAFLVINLVVFVETGLLVGFFLPGDSLLVTAGLVCFHSHWNLPLLLVTLSLAAIIGDTVGYTIGWRTGPKIFNREKSLLFARDHLLKAQAFYERHGGKTIILARFMPIIRTFAPVVAGVGGMRYRKFLFYNIFGGIGWVCSMVLTGYYLTRLLDPLLQPILGANFRIQDHIEKVIIVVVLLSISPPFFVWVRHKLTGKVTPPTAPGPDRLALAPDKLASAPVAAGEP